MLKITLQFLRVEQLMNEISCLCFLCWGT